jgi:hypothetical protein
MTTLQNRRMLLKRGLLAAAGAVGLGAATRDAKATLAMPATGTRELRLYGRAWRLETPGRRPGDAIQPGDHGAVSGELLDRPNGRVIGRFHGSRLATGPRAHAAMEVHTLVLPKGTIVGMGTSLLGEAVFAVVGGTGAYATARGSYVARQRLRELGGNGTAEFTLTLDAGKEA